jgi:hypothetical protein
MTLPALNKSWQFRANRALPALGTAIADNRALLLEFRDGMKGLGSGWVDGTGAGTTPTNCFVTRYSCNSVTAGTAGDGVDRWTTSADLVWAAAGSAHSWYVFRQVAIATNFEALVSCEGAAGSGQLLTVVVSPSAGFTGGSTTARPTATDEIVLLAGLSWTNISSDISCRLHVQSSTDGQCTRLWVYQAGAVVAFWSFEKPQNPVASWTNPSASAVLGNVSSTLANLNDVASYRGRGASSMAMYLTTEYAGSARVASSMPGPNALSAAWPFLGSGLYSLTAANEGRHGNLFDLWWGLVAANEGDTYPDSGTTKQFAQVGDLIVPWCRTTMLTA